MTPEQAARLAALRAITTLTQDEANELVTLATLEETGQAIGSNLVTLEAADEEDGDGWYVEGLALPYGEEMSRMDWLTGATRQVFEAGSATVREGAALFYGHDHLDRQMPIGTITESKDTPEGLWIKAAISKTAKGTEAHTLLSDGVLRHFSVGFAQVTNVLEDAGTDNPLLRHQAVEVLETSTVWDPQYETAQIHAVLSRQGTRTTTPPTTKGPTMTQEQRDRLAALRAMTNLSQADAAEMATLVLLERAEDGDTPATRAEVQSLSRELETMGRQMATLGQGGGGDLDGPPPCFLEFQGYGHWLQAAAANDPQALEVLAYVGGVVGDLGAWVKDSWVGDLYRPLQERRRVLNLFQTRPLPASGMGVEFGRLKADTTAVAEQVAEGDLLAYGGIEFETDRAGLETYGGWGELSRQEIERSSMAIVEKFFAALLQRYARVTEAAVRAFALDPANGTELPGAVIPDLSTVNGWTDLILDSAFYLEDQGLVPEFALVDRETFKDAAKIQVGPDGDYFLGRTTGTVDVKGVSGTVYNVQLIPVVAPANTVRICAPEGLATFEASGAPFRLQDDDITHLTKAFSIYGYMAVADEDHNAILRPQAV
jgi:hypothetical protein